MILTRTLEPKIYRLHYNMQTSSDISINIKSNIIIKRINNEKHWIFKGTQKILLV